jgi:hypothetical protein
MLGLWSGVHHRRFLGAFWCAGSRVRFQLWIVWLLPISLWSVRYFRDVKQLPVSFAPAARRGPHGPTWQQGEPPLKPTPGPRYTSVVLHVGRRGRALSSFLLPPSHVASLPVAISFMGLIEELSSACSKSPVRKFELWCLRFGLDILFSFFWTAELLNDWYARLLYV